MPADQPQTKSRLLGYAQLAASLLVIGVIWLGVLPWLGEQPAIRKQIEARDKLGIDLGAMFYTDLEAMGAIEANLEAFQQKNPAALWNPWSSGEISHKAPSAD